MTSPRLARPVAVLAPTGRDADVTARVLEEDGFAAVVCADMDAMCATLVNGAGALLVAEEALGSAARSRLLATLDQQPAWSDVPLIVLTGEGQLSPAPSRSVAALAERGNLTLLERPVRRATFVTTIRSALRARQRQFEVRDHLAERTQHETMLLDARQQAEVANEAKTRFLATMSHELRTPLNAIAGYAELMTLELHGPITPEQRADLQRIERSQRYLLSLINDILNFAKIESGQVPLADASFAVDPLLRELDAFVAPQLAAKGVTYEYVASQPDCRVRGDPEKVQQILLNLLSNAIKFTPRGGSIAVQCAADGRNVLVRVTDTGPGIPADKREAVFEPFVQLDRGLTSSAQGTGLGLSISRELARRMGGDLSVRDAPMGGASFELVLPGG